MVKTFIITILFLLVTIVASPSAHAEERVCVTQYGGSVVCGSNPPQIHTPVKAGLGDVSLKLMSIVFLGSSGFMYFYSRRHSDTSSFTSS